MAKTFYSSEFGMAACIVFGQTLVKLIAEFIKIRDELDSGAISVLCSIVVLCLIFSSVILTFVMIFGEKLPIWIIHSQIIMFGFSIVMHFVYFGVKQQRAAEQKA
ncbi:MAG: hypothetical protein RL571_3095 [Pseudomonadota bacterium]